MSSRNIETRSFVRAAQQRSDIIETLRCSVCFDLLVQPTRVDGCAHVFCYSCISTWNMRSNSCPMCRAVISDLVIAACTKTARAQNITRPWLDKCPMSHLPVRTKLLLAKTNYSVQPPYQMGTFAPR